MRARQYLLASVLLSLIVYLSLSWYILDGPKAINNSYIVPTNDTMRPGGTMENLFWFVQVSDLHINMFGYKSRASDFRLFCSKIIPSIDPSLVIVTGDLTDSRRSKYETDQYIEEWQSYHNIIKETGVANSRPWLDLPGNHDSFNVLEHLVGFRKYSQSWRRYGVESYCYQHTTSFGNYSFIGVDAHPAPGPRLPYNFFGILDEADLVGIQQLSQKCHDKVNHTIWFSHYPSSIITTDHKRFLELLSSSIALLSGHLHNVFGFYHNLHTVHPDGRLELELADWKYVRRYRILAIDHDLLSFQDVFLHNQPVIVITNPKHHQYLSPSHEPVGRIVKSTHIRVLIFSPDPIISVSILLDDEDIGTVDHVTGPLYVAKWEPLKYRGLHYINVIAKDKGGHVATVTQPFSWDTQPDTIGLFQAFVLQANLPMALRLLFMLLWLILVGRLLTVRWQGKGSSSDLVNIARTNCLYYPLLLFLLNYGLGVWFVGELISGLYGIVSVHGLIMANSFNPGAMTYLHGCVMLILVHYPMVSLIASLAKRKVTSSSASWCGCYTLICSLLKFASSLIISYFFINIMTSAYGWTAFVLSPGLTWGVVMYLVMIGYIFMSSNFKS